MMIDLHMHSVFSVDARDEPEQLIQCAADQGISAVAITEHNNVASLQRAKAEAERLKLTYVHGIEIGSRLAMEGHPESVVDILGYHFDEDATHISKLCNRMRARQQWATDTVLAGLALMDIPITLERVQAAYPDRVSTWAIRRMLREEGLAADKPESSRIETDAIKRALEHEPARVAQRGPAVTTQETIDAIHADGGMAFMAHPFWLTKPERGGFPPEFIWAQIERVFELGVDGLEAFNTSNDSGYAPHVLKYCRERGCPASGGSDSHGIGIIGSAAIPDELLESMQRHRQGLDPWTG